MIIHELAEYVWLIVAMIAILPFFFKKSTRKIAFKILFIVVIVLAALAAIMIAGLYFFKEAFFIFFTPAILDGFLLYWFLLALRDLISTVALHRKGCRTFGTVIGTGYGRGGHYRIKYTVNGITYECIAALLTQKRKWQVGSENIPVLYDEKNPNQSCVEKHDMVGAVSVTVGAGIFVIVAIVSTVIVLLAVFK